MKNGVTMHSEDVNDSADAEGLMEEGRFRLRVLTLSGARVHAWLG